MHIMIEYLNEYYYRIAPIAPIVCSKESYRVTGSRSNVTERAHTSNPSP
jgi:hypothetical protein